MLMSPSQGLFAPRRNNNLTPSLRFGLLALCTLLVMPGVASAQSVDIEVSRGPVSGGSRVVGLGGAYTSVAEGLAGLAFNSATLANRDARGKTWWDMDVAAGWSFLPLESTDYENDGQTNGKVERQRVLGGGVLLQGGYLGIAYQGSSRYYGIVMQESPRREAAFTFVEHLLGAAYQIESLGASIGITGIFERTRIEAENADCFVCFVPGGFFNQTVATQVLEGDGPGTLSGMELGSLYRPRSKPYRVGASLRISTSQTVASLENEEQFEAVDIPLPETVRSPTKIRIGASYQFGKAYNARRRWRTIPEQDWYREKVKGWDPKWAEREAPIFNDDSKDRYILFSADVVLIAPQLFSQSIYRGPEGFAVNRDERAGSQWNFGFHVGTEAEPIPGWLRVRAGSYYEPSRFQGVDGRLHVTFGFDAHFPHIWALEKAKVEEEYIGWMDVPLTARAYIDYATRDFLSIGISVGIWR